MQSSPRSESETSELSELRARLADTERRLADCGRRLADAEQLAGMGWWRWSPDGGPTEWSDGLCALFGLPPGSVPSGERLRAIVFEEDRGLVEHNQNARGDEYHEMIEYRVAHPDGQVRYLRGRRRAAEQAPDGTTLYHGITQDVTDLRVAEIATREAHDALELAFDQAPVGMLLVSPVGQLLRANPAICRLLECSEESLLTRSLRDIVHPDDRRIDRGQLASLIAGEITTFQVEKRFMTETGEARWVDGSVSLVRHPDGRPDYLIVQVLDVGARKLAEQRMREAEVEARVQRDHAETIIAAMHDGYALTVGGGEIQAVNAAWCRMIGYSEQELLGMRLPYPFWVPGEEDESMALRDRVVAAGGGTFQIAFERKDGSRFEAEVTATVAHGPLGEPIGFVNTLRDVSASNRDRRELERMARTDSLTGLANRFVLEEALAHEAGRRATDGQLALILLDLDRFKEINDAYGHPVGDAVLVEVAERLSRTARAGEVLARVGGEEFAWLLPAARRDEAVAAADRARAAIACRPFRGAGALTMSAGVGVVGAPFDTDLLYRFADRALYDAKQAGRNRTCCADDDAWPAGAPEPPQPDAAGSTAVPPVAAG